MNNTFSPTKPAPGSKQQDKKPKNATRTNNTRTSELTQLAEEIQALLASI